MAQDETITIQILDADGAVVTEIKTNDPAWSFEQFCRNRVTVDWTWREAVPA